MDSLAFIIPFGLVGIAGAIVLFIVAVVQEGKSGHQGGFRMAFFTVVSLVMLTITIGSTIALLNIGLRQFVFKSATSYQQRFTTPPVLILPSQNGGAIPAKGVAEPTTVAPVPPTTEAYACTKDCQLTPDDKTAIGQWVTDYKTWQTNQGLSLETRRGIANALGFLIVALPLYVIFFRLMKRSHASVNGKPGPVWSLYFSAVAFAGLVMAVVAMGVIINDGLKVWLHTDNANGTVSEPAVATTYDQGVKSLLACSGQCGLTAEQVHLAHQWETDMANYQAIQQKSTGQFSSELAAAIPFVLLGLPLFLYHFGNVRRDPTESTSSPATPTS